MFFSTGIAIGILPFWRIGSTIAMYVGASEDNVDGAGFMGAAAAQKRGAEWRSTFAMYAVMNMTRLWVIRTTA